MYRILITGATGFVGSHVSKYLGNLGYDIEALSKVEFMAEDFSRLDNMHLDNDGKPDVLIHCAWTREKDLHSVEHMEMAEMSCNLINECAKRGIRVINIGSSSEYGVKDEPMREDMACEPISAYGIGKLSVTLFAKKLGFNTLRIFTATGEGGHSFADIKDKTDKWSNPMDVRDFIPIEKVCVAVERLLHARHLYGEIINCGDGESKTYWSVSKGGNEGEWLKYPQRQYEPSIWVADTTKMSRLLNI